MQGYCFELITGPMSCGKTEELLRRIRRSIIAKKKVKVISPCIDTREQGDYIKSRNGLWLDAVKVKHSIQILSLVKEDDEILILQTCSTHDDYKDYSQKYLLIIARRVKNEEKIY